MTQSGPGPFWNCQPTTFYFVAHYPNNGANEAPDIIDPIMYTYPNALARAKALIQNAGNIGVSTITPITSEVVYPPTFFSASAPN